MITLETKCGKITGLENDSCYSFLGVPYAKAERFEYAVPVTKWEENFEATKNGDACEQIRAYFPYLENPARYFYFREFREGIDFKYSEDCLNLNIFTPKAPGSYPVIVYFHGGSFNAGANSDGAFKGDEFAKKGIITVFANYRVGIFGYLTHSEVFEKNGRDGNFGLDDQLKAIQWVKENISAFNGDSENITIMGQSAGAISVQYHSLNHNNKDLFKHAVMLSGGGKFPDFALPRPAEQTREYWTSFMDFGKIKDFNELKTMEAREIISLMEDYKKTRKDNTYNTMPVVDGYLLKTSVKELIKNPLKIDYLLGYTNSDMYAPLMAFVEHKYAKQNKAYIYYFDIDPKGDKTRAFHSSDLRFAFKTLAHSWRPFEQEDYEASEVLQCYLKNFATCGNPNGEKPDDSDLPHWKKGGKRALHLRAGKKIKMTHKHYLKLLWNVMTELKLV